MLEIGEVKFIEKEFLKNYDLADVPGVSEYIKSLQMIIKMILIRVKILILKIKVI